MNKAELIDKLSKDTGIEKVDVVIITEALFKQIKTNLLNNEETIVRGFGTFITVKRADKTAFNMKSREKIIIPSHLKPKLNFSKEFMDLLRDKTTEQNEH